MAKTDNKEQAPQTETNSTQSAQTLAMQQEIDVLKAQKTTADKNIASLQQQLEETQRIKEEHDLTISKLQEQVDQLTRDNDALQHQISIPAPAHAENENEIDKLEEQLANKNAEITQLNTTIHLLQQQLQDEKVGAANKIAHIDNQFKNAIMLSPIAENILNEVAQQLSNRYGRSITPRDVVSDYILRYNIQRWNQWFHPFVLSDQQILEIAQQENQEIRSIKQLKAALHIKDQV